MESPNSLTVWKDDMPVQTYRRGNTYLDANTLRFTHTPAGHPEGFLEAFSSIYSEATRHILALKNGEVKDPKSNEFDYPTVYDGARGVRFIEKVIESSRTSQKWISF